MHQVFQALEGKSSRHALIRAGIQTGALLGIDKVSVAHVIVQADVSRPTFYSYFDDVNSLWAETWIEVGALWLQSLADPDIQTLQLTDSTQVFLTEMFLAAPRIPELMEVMRSDLFNLWRKMEREGDVAIARQCWNIGLAIGITSAVSVLPTVSAMTPVIEIVSAMPNEWNKFGNKRAQDVNVIPRVSEPIISEEDEVTSRLLDASIDVVARAGLEQASLTRVCRAARVTTGSARPRFESTQELVLQGFDRMIASVVGENISEYETATMGTNPWDAFAAFTISGLHSSRRKWRQYRQEMHIAARVNPEIAQHLNASFSAVNKKLADSLAELNIDQRGIDLSILLNHVLAIGFGALSAVEYHIENVNHFAVTAWLEQQTGLSMNS